MSGAEVARPVASPIATAGLGRWGWAAASLVLLLGLGALVRYLDTNVASWFPTVNWLKSVEFPIYAIAVGLATGAILGALGLRDRLTVAFRTEFLIKTGLVLLGASINLAVIARAAGPAILQSIILISSVFLISWWVGGRLSIDPKLRALLSAAVSICGVSAAIAAAGAVAARREQLAYVTSLVILFALPSIFIQPWLAQQLGLDPVVAGAWIGGNIDTTAAVTAAGTIVGDDALKIAAIVKQTQNAMMGIVAVLLTAYFVFRVERVEGATVGLGALWQRFPKFIIGFVAASALATLFINSAADAKAAGDIVAVAGTNLRVWFFILAFVCIGVEFRPAALREAGARPVAVFAAASLANLVLALILATLLFSGFKLA
ncbi:MAG TPA: putative sulfate exporter family transporter [Candidatus Limnocylindrales bacterium]|nr:putative sulfate exporter family transporter [Candidatus Limnocylindrales bacterium]